LELAHPGGVGEVLLDPDGGEWMRAKLVRLRAEGVSVVSDQSSVIGDR
jgi:hypothetical protein